MADERRSNSRDWELVHYPACPRCGAANAPRRSPMIERLQRPSEVYACACCGTEFVPTPPTR